jgi:hypothetical protein
VVAFNYIAAEQFGEGIAKDPSGLQRVAAAAAGLPNSLRRVMYMDIRVCVFRHQTPAQRHNKKIK